jgi:AhpD family alkylhydroperoxidase
MNNEYRKSCSIKEFVYLIDDAFISMKDYKKVMKEKQIDEMFKEKIMLAVTEINGCELCNAYHTKNVEKLETSQIKVAPLVIQELHIATTKEDIALEFAKHYALENGNYSKNKWNELVEAYDKETAKGILGVVRIIMMGNVHGIAAGALLDRLKFKPVKDSGFLNEIGITVGIILIAPYLAIKRSLLNIFSY